LTKSGRGVESDEMRRDIIARQTNVDARARATSAEWAVYF